MGAAGLEPATIRLKAQCSANWATHPYIQNIRLHLNVLGSGGLLYTINQVWTIQMTISSLAVKQKKIHFL